MHDFYYLEGNASTFSINEAIARTAYHADFPEGVTHGNVAVRAAIASAVKWPERPGTAEDLEFNSAVYARTAHTAVVKLPLLTYRQNFSSFG